MINIEDDGLQNLEIEYDILYALINQNEYQPLILSRLKTDNFVDENNRIIFRIVSELINQEVPVDIHTIKNKLNTNYSVNSEINEIIMHLLNNILSRGNVDNINHKIDIIINQSAKNKLDNLSKKIISTNVDLNNPNEEFDSWSSEIDTIINSRNIGNIDLIKVPIEEYQNVLLNSTFNRDEITGVTSGFEKIDEFTNGFQPGDLIILAARPSIGKTALAINFILNAVESFALDSNNAVVFFSLEMSKQQIIQRMAANLANIDGNKIRNSQLTPDDKAVINFKLDELKKHQIFIEDKPNMTILDIESRLRQLIQTNTIKLVVIDYLQLIESTSQSYNRVQEVGKISRRLKIMARELKVPIIAIAQLSRKIEDRKIEDRRPMLSDLRESGSIEQDADLVTFIDYDRNQIDNKNSNAIVTKNFDRVAVNFYIEKHRNGMTGQVRLWFNKPQGKFLNFAGKKNE